MICSSSMTAIGLVIPLSISRGQQLPPGSDSARRLPAVEVHASILPTAQAVGAETPARVSTIDGALLEQWKRSRFQETMAHQPGISLYDDLGAPSKQNLILRGFATGPTVGIPSGLTVFVDGVRQNEPDAQEVNFDLLPINNVERIELLNGNASLLGPNALGGAINIVTARGSGVGSGDVELTTGSFGAYGAHIGLDGRRFHGWDSFIGAGMRAEHGWRETTSENGYSSMLNVGQDEGGRGLRLRANVSRSRVETAGSLPESIFESSPRVNFSAGDFEDIDGQQISVFAYSNGAHGQAAMTLYARRSAAERFNVNQAPDPDVRGFTTNRTLGGTADWRWSSPINRGVLSLRVGIDAATNWVHVKIFNEDTATHLTTDVRSPNWDLGTYVLADYALGRAALSLGARGDRVQTPFHNLLNQADETTTTYSQISPRAGITIELSRSASIYASAGKSFRAPAILELGCADPEAACPLPFALGDDPPLRPVEAMTYETGIRMTRGSASIGASLFRTDARSEIFFVASDEALLSGYFTNFDRTRRDGIELFAQGNSLRHRFEWFVNYAYTRASFRSSADLFSIRAHDDFEDSPFAGANEVVAGDRLPLIPDHQAKGGTTFQFSQRLNGGFDVSYTGHQWLRGDEANQTTPLDDYFRIDARFGVRVLGWTVTAVATNLLDTHKAIFGTFNENRRTGDLERFLTPMNARSIGISARRQFGGVR